MKGDFINGDDIKMIRPIKKVYPQIYAYTLKDVKEKDGWIKIGYTEKEDVEVRIRQQLSTVNLGFNKLWSAPACFDNGFVDAEKWFLDKDFHRFLIREKKVAQQDKSEWFFYNGTPEQSYIDFQEFRSKVFGLGSRQKAEYVLRDEQRRAVENTLAHMKTNIGGKFLWNAKPRFGKTLSSYDLVVRAGLKKVLIVTNRPAIANSWLDDFKKFIEWQYPKYAFVSEIDNLQKNGAISREKHIEILGEKPYMITFISLQDLKGSLHFGGKFNKRKWIGENHWDLLIIDEAHEAIDTKKTERAFEYIKRDFTLHLSGTPFKALASDKFREEEIFNWTYQDEQYAKKNWDSLGRFEENTYRDMPSFVMFSYKMSDMIVDKVNQGIDIYGENKEYAFDLNEFFRTETKLGKPKFVYEDDVKTWLDTLTDNEKYPFSTKELRNNLKHTFWIMNRVDSAKALKVLLEGHKVFENYEIVLAAGDGKLEDEDVVSKEALENVKRAIGKHEKTITLSVGKLTTGITVPEWSAVLMLSNMKSSASYIQTIFRAQNPYTVKKDGHFFRKNKAYVFDFAPERTLIVYDEFANSINKSTANGKGTSKERKENIKELLNFFPVIAEDEAGTMIPLDAEKVLSLPKTIKAKEVVKRGFMSNFLFKNIAGIFSSREAVEIIENFMPTSQGKVKKSNSQIDLQDVSVDDEGKVLIDREVVIAKTDAKFGDKVYEEIEYDILKLIGDGNLKDGKITKEIENNTKEIIKSIGEGYDNIKEKEAEKIFVKNFREVEENVRSLREKGKIEKKIAKADLDEKLKEVWNEKEKSRLKEEYANKVKKIEYEYDAKVKDSIKEEMKKAHIKSSIEIEKKSKEKKKNDVEQEVRARLRGFSRTIPSFLMAYGDEHTSLATFDKIIEEDVFVEMTGINLEQFRKLRDDYQFFDSIVFDESVKEFLEKKKELSNYFEDREENIFDYIPPQKTNQIFTPKRVVNMMLDKLEEENPKIFSDPSMTFLDPYMKSGLYITEIVKRLYKGLEGQIYSPANRIKHILENQVQGFAPSKIIFEITKNFIFGFDESHNIKRDGVLQIDALSYLKDGKIDELKSRAKTLRKGRDMKFDVVVGNPPYQEENNGNNETFATPIYPFFYNFADEVSDKYILITPARFLFNAGATNKQWNKKMLEDPHIKVVYYEQKSAKVFENTDIKGGWQSYTKTEPKTLVA